jgi:hypothetical protein
MTVTQFNNVKQYLEYINYGCLDGLVLYDAVRFNCLHLAHHCLRLAGFGQLHTPTERVWFARTITPRLFIKTIMPDAHFSIPDHDLDYRIEILG